MNIIDMATDKYLFKRCYDGSSYGGTFFHQALFSVQDDSVPMSANVETKLFSFIPKISGTLEVDEIKVTGSQSYWQGWNLSDTLQDIEERLKALEG